MDEETGYLAYFNLSSYSWPVQEMCTRRAQMSDLLIFDILLSAGGIRHPHLLYPPAEPEGLKSLLTAIENSSYDSLKRDCLVYLLLKWHTDGADRPVRFAAERSIPVQFTMLADAYWSLDAGRQIALAVSTLADARLNRDYSSKILQAISLSPLSAPLILKYVRTAKPPLLEPDDIDVYTLALAQTSLLDAWRFVRTFADKDETKDRLVRNVLVYCLAPRPKPAALSSLLTLPFTSYELNLIRTFALSPQSIPPTSVPIIHDFVFTHLLSKADYHAALDWARILEASPLSTKEHVKKAIEERRDQVEVLKNMLGGVDLTPPKASANSDMNVDVDGSWEDLGRSLSGKTAQAPKATEKPVTNGVKADPPPILSGLFPANAIRVPLASIPPPAPSKLPAIPTKPKVPPVSKNIVSNGSASTTHLSNGKTRNAFYEPPPPAPAALPVAIPDNVKRPREEEMEDATGAGADTEDEADMIRRARRRIHHDTDTDMEVEPTVDENQGFNGSVFSPPPPEPEPVSAPASIQEDQVDEDEHEVKKVKASREKRPKKIERTKSRQLPGAFVDGEPEPAPAPQPSLSTRSTRKSTAAKVPATPTRTSARRSAAASNAKNISIPGSLISEDDEEDADEVPPLPRTKKAKAIKEATTPRRSTRLSTDRSMESVTSTKGGRGSRKKA